ncbi:MAG: thiolase family protein [Lachnospiraceae bacterium]|nr:thiolase family protein [Lachnospiraceae bacterium]
MNPFNQTNPHKISRSVSIIGVGCTPFMETLKNPETEGLTEGELFGYAALKAMEDAGVSPKDVDFYFHGCASPMGSSNYMTPNMQVAEWFGMRGKASAHHSEACCTGYLALDLAMQSVASGKYDIVLTGGIDFGDALAKQGIPSCFRHSFSFEVFQRSTEWLIDNAYTRHLMGNSGFDNTGRWYQNYAGLTADELDKALCMCAIVNRENAALNPLAIDRVTYQEEAKAAGYDDVMEYMQSDNNPKLSETQRISGLEHKCDGAAALILCATDLEEKFSNNKPIEILGVGNSALELSNPVLEVQATQEASRQVFNVTGVKPEEIDLLYVNDFVINSQLISAEMSGYIPDKQAWKYIMDGRTRYNGDKPINPNGGRTAFGHAHAASGLADFYDAALQMRGKAGAHQINKIPKTVFLRGYGGGQNICNVIIRTKD